MKLFLPLLLLLLPGCYSFKKLQEHYQQRVDSTKVIVPYVVTIPKDSVVIRAVAKGRDTLIIHEKGRSRLVIERYRDTVRISCNCDSVRVEGKKTVVIGNKPVYRSGIPWWVYAVGVGLVAFNLYLLYLVAMKTYNIRIDRK